MRSTHPGQVLKDELNAIGKRAISGDSASRFGHWFGTDPAFWMTRFSPLDEAAPRHWRIWLMA